jgi:hypothetical protein
VVVVVAARAFARLLHVFAFFFALSFFVFCEKVFGHFEVLFKRSNRTKNFPLCGSSSNRSKALIERSRICFLHYTIKLKFIQESREK